MIKKYTYKGKEYTSVNQLKKDIWEQDGKAFSTPSDASGWAIYGVVYQELPDPGPVEPSLEEVKQTKLNELERKFLSWYENDAKMISSLGYECDSDARAMMDVNGLVIAAESGTMTYSSIFMDANNQPHTVSLEQLKTIQLEIITAGQSAYNEKWTYRSAIESATSVEEVNGITISFTKCDFSDNEAS